MRYDPWPPYEVSISGKWASLVHGPTYVEGHPPIDLSKKSAERKLNRLRAKVDRLNAKQERERARVAEVVR